MPRIQPCRPRLAIALLLFAGLFFSARTLRMALKTRGQADDKFTYYEALLAGVHARLTPESRVQILLPAEKTQDEEAFFIIQYTLSPVVITNQADAPYVVSVYPGVDATPAYRRAVAGLTLLHDFHNGVSLFSRTLAP